LANASFVGEPDFYRLAVERFFSRDCLQTRGETFLKFSIARAEAILAAIEDGRIAGMKDILDGWYVERAKLCHVFPPAPAGAAKFDNRRALDAAALMLEMGIWALVRTAGDKLRRPCIIWRLLPRMRLWGINHP
jgi:hypothetical protein